MNYVEMKKAEAELNLALAPQKKQRGASRAQLEHRAYMLKCCVWCGIPFSMHSVELTNDCSNARS